MCNTFYMSVPAVAKQVTCRVAIMCAALCSQKSRRASPQVRPFVSTAVCRLRGESCFVSCVRDTALLISSNSQNFGSNKILAPSARHSVAATVMSVSRHWPLTSHCGVVRFRDLTSIRGPSKSAQASASPTEHRACGRKCFEPPRHCLGASPGMLDWTF